jgi:N-formylglutamate amidohydrolase
LNIIVEKYLEFFGEVLFIDLHSYYKDILPYELNTKANRPEICIGINENVNEKILKDIVNKIELFNYDYSINEPFSGCLLPSNYVNDDRVHGIMIEIRKDIYENKKGFNKIKKLLNEI